jgi:hypothetical protein
LRRWVSSTATSSPLGAKEVFGRRTIRCRSTSPTSSVSCRRFVADDRRVDQVHRVIMRADKKGEADWR